jgi:hypothetical protein
MSNLKSYFVLFFVLIICFISQTNVARDNLKKDLQVSLKHFVKDNYPMLNISWIGTGEIGRFTISNFGENGYFEPPPNWPGYTGEFPNGYTTGNGELGEFPRGSGQYYVWDAGAWFGAMVPVIIGTDTLYEDRVAACAYYSDLATVSELYQTNQIIPESHLNGAGEYLFVQPGQTQQPYQQVWDKTDLTLNARRPLNFQLQPGDFVSSEDTYTEYGDFIPEPEAITAFLPPYADKPVGIKVEQRTYSWFGQDFIFLNYKITNINDFVLRDFYCGYFMDNDIGPDAVDDLIGFNTMKNAGYSFDSDGVEIGWTTLAGYIGTVLCKTPADSGLTGFQTWDSNGPEAGVDNRSGADSLKYYQLQKGGYETFQYPQDVRQLSASGPYIELQPQEEIEFTVAVVAGEDSVDFLNNVDAANLCYQYGYLTLTPAVYAAYTDKKFVAQNDTVNIIVKTYAINGIQSVKITFDDYAKTIIDSIELYDDGNHNDGQPGDFVYGGAWIVPGGSNYYSLNAKVKDYLSNVLLVQDFCLLTKAGPVSISNYLLYSGDSLWINNPVNPWGGDSVKLSLRNNGSVPLTNLQIILEGGENLYITNSDTLYLSSLNPGEEELVDQWFFVIPNSNFIANGDSANAKAYIHEIGIPYFWNQKLPIPIYDNYKPVILSEGNAIFENGAGPVVNPGENVRFSVRIREPSGLNLLKANILHYDGTVADSNVVAIDYSNGIAAFEWQTPAISEELYLIYIDAIDNAGNRIDDYYCGEFSTDVFSIQNTVLLVDNDNVNYYSGYSLFPFAIPEDGYHIQQSPIETFYTESFDSLGIQYDIWHTSVLGTPDTNILNQYDKVFWETGLRPVLNNEEINIITNYAHLIPGAGGKFTVFGESGVPDSYLFSNSSSSLNVIDSLKLIGIPGDSIGDGINILVGEGRCCKRIMEPRELDEKNTLMSGINLKFYKNNTDLGGALISTYFNMGNFKANAIECGIGLDVINFNERTIIIERILHWLDNISGVSNNTNILPKTYSLKQNYPNPFNPSTTIRFGLPEYAEVTMLVYNVLGKKVKVLVDKKDYSAGYYNVTFNGSNLPSGTYFVRLKTKNYSNAIKLLLMK